MIINSTKYTHIVSCINSMVLTLATFYFYFISSEQIISIDNTTFLDEDKISVVFCIVCSILYILYFVLAGVTVLSTKEPPQPAKHNSRHIASAAAVAYEQRCKQEMPRVC